MHRKRLSLRQPFEAVYNGRTRLSASKSESLAEVWLFLEQLCSGQVSVNPPSGRATPYRIRLPGGNTVYMVIGRPAPDDPDHDCDLFVQDLFWPEDLN